MFNEPAYCHTLGKVLGSPQHLFYMYSIHDMNMPTGCSRNGAYTNNIITGIKRIATDVYPQYGGCNVPLILNTTLLHQGLSALLTGTLPIVNVSLCGVLLFVYTRV